MGGGTRTVYYRLNEGFSSEFPIGYSQIDIRLRKDGKYDYRNFVITTKLSTIV